MTNLDYIRHFANDRPELLATLLDDIYCIGWNDGAGDFEDRIDFTLDWLNAEADGMYFNL